MVYILISALIFMVLTSLVLIRNRFEFKSIHSIKPENSSNCPKVSICIPARNEEAVIERCVTSLVNQDYSDFEVIVLDDNSEDKTLEILQRLTNVHPTLKIIHGKPKPDDWLGKPWACHQLSREASGEIFVFVDSDVWMEHDVISKTVMRMQSLDSLTIWPQQRLESFFERLIVPTIYFSLLTLLPTVYVERSPRWMAGFLRPHLNQKFTAGCGQFFAFTKSAYEKIGGHESVKNQVVEDMELAIIIKGKALSLSMMNGIESVYCRMYSSGYEIWQGFQKNFLSGFGNLFEFLFMAVLHALFFLFPIYALMIGILFNEQTIVILSAAVIGIYIFQRLMLNLWFRWNWIMAFLHPFSVVWFQILGLKCLVNRIFGLKSSWKGRQV